MYAPDAVRFSTSTLTPSPGTVKLSPTSIGASASAGWTEVSSQASVCGWASITSTGPPPDSAPLRTRYTSTPCRHPVTSLPTDARASMASTLSLPVRTTTSFVPLPSPNSGDPAVAVTDEPAPAGPTSTGSRVSRVGPPRTQVT